MTIPTYLNEAKAGLSDKISDNNTVAYCVEAKSDNSKNADLKLNEKRALAQNDNQKDLFYISSVLVSTGWNKNDDVFDPKAVWASRNTPEDKQFNLEHDEKRIIGHITKNTTVHFNGEEIVSEEMPKDFEILISSVLYTRWSDPDIREEIFSIIDEIEQGDWSVSMECIFNDFDYAVETPEGETVVIARDEDSSFLTQHLRAYGGSGVFEDHKIGRCLKNITFSGVGLVKNPANPRSVIKNTSFETAKLNDVFKQENKMELEELKAKFDEVNTKLEASKKDVEAQKLLLDEVKSASEAKDSEITSLKEKLEAAEAKNKEYAKNEVTASRKMQLTEAGVESEEINEIVARYSDYSDDVFAEVLALKKELVAAMKKMNKAEDDKDEDKEDDKEDDKVDANVDDIEAEASHDLGVEENEEEVKASRRSAVTKWLTKAVNKAKEKETV